MNIRPKSLLRICSVDTQRHQIDSSADLIGEPGKTSSDDAAGLAALGREYLDEGWRGSIEHECAFACLHRAAILGNAEAQYLMGGMYRDSEDSAENHTLADFWFAQAAEQNHVDAQLTLASRYFFGHRVLKDDTIAEFWLRRAASIGSVEAQYNLRILANLRAGIRAEPSNREEQLMIRLGFRRLEEMSFYVNIPDHPVIQKCSSPVYPDDSPEAGSGDLSSADGR